MFVRLRSCRFECSPFVSANQEGLETPASLSFDIGYLTLANSFETNSNDSNRWLPSNVTKTYTTSYRHNLFIYFPALISLTSYQIRFLGCALCQIWIYGPNVCKGYLYDEKKTKETIDEDGWLHSGDIGEWLPVRREYIFSLFRAVRSKLENLLGYNVLWD